jgi:hypothetical protein
MSLENNIAPPPKIKDTKIVRKIDKMAFNVLSVYTFTMEYATVFYFFNV